MADGGPGGHVDSIRQSGKSRTEQAILADSAGPSFIDTLTITSNEEGRKKVSLLPGVVRIQYWESLLQDCVKATVTYADGGNTIEKDGKKVSAREGLPIVGSETVDIKVTDNNKNTLILKMLVNKPAEIFTESTKSLVRLDMAAMEYFTNEKVRIKTRMDGKISDHVRKILKEDEKYLATEEHIYIEPTSNNYNFIGNNKKPFWTLNWLAKRAVPDGGTGGSSGSPKGNTAGYLFYAAGKTYYFRSIESLMGQEQKISVIYTQSPDEQGEKIPEGYDVKALTYAVVDRLKVKDKMNTGYAETRLKVFDAFNCKYVKQEDKAADIEKKDGITTAGKNLPKLNPDLNRKGGENFSKTTWCLLDRGSLPTGSGKGQDQEQLDKSKEENADPKSVTNQSIMRLNQLFSEMVSITLPGVFSLHVGDAIYVDSPQLQQDTGVCADQPDKFTGGKYVICDLCHYITTEETYTKLNLMRDSVGRKGKPTKTDGNTASIPTEKLANTGTGRNGQLGTGTYGSLRPSG